MGKREKMSVSPATVIDQVRKGPAGQGGEIHAGDSDLRLYIKLADWDRLGCLVERVEMKKSCPLLLDPDRITQEITYLGEGLRVIERDEKERKTVLRSHSPLKEGSRISFFEMVLHPAEGLSFVRFAYDREMGKRFPIPSSLTRNTLERLITDLMRLAT
jgi:hypothetical protein